MESGSPTAGAEGAAQIGYAGVPGTRIGSSRTKLPKAPCAF